jgi:hypothetical protein
MFTGMCAIGVQSLCKAVQKIDLELFFAGRGGSDRPRAGENSLLVCRSEDYKPVR